MPRQTTLPHPAQSIVLPDGRLSTEWREALNSFVKYEPRAGTATFGSSTSIAVTLSPNEPDANYDVFIAPTENKTFWSTSRAVTGFTLNASSASSATIGWHLTRR